MGEQHFLKLGQQRFRAQPASSQAASRGQPTDLIGQHLYCATVAHRQGHLNAALPTENLSLAKSAPAVDTPPLGSQMNPHQPKRALLLDDMRLLADLMTGQRLCPAVQAHFGKLGKCAAVVVMLSIAAWY